MKTRFFIDPETNAPHCLGHGVEEHEVIEVLDWPLGRYRSRDDTLVALGKTDGGRFLKVIYSVERGEYFVITAYPLEGKALKAFKRRKK